MSTVQQFACETVIFGKGIGESIAVRLGLEEWMIIDSCLNDDKKPAALDYLLSRGVDPKEVKLIIISHFHDDHIKGIYDIIQNCSESKVVISAALNTQEFRSYIAALSKNGEEMAKTKEINKVMSLFPVLHRDDRLVHAKKDCTLYRSHASVQVYSLSPSDVDITNSNLDFANSTKISSNFSEIATSAKLVNPNHYCVVTRVFSPTSTNNEILLGADLEVSKNSGWDSVCNAISRPEPNLAGLFKLPHHGSKTGYHEDTWEKLIRKRPISVMTTYDKSALPRQDMIDLYKSKSSALYCTSLPKSNDDQDKTSSKTSEALKILKKMNSSVSFSNRNNKFGIVAINNCLTPTPVVEVKFAAVAL
ncbi:MBL fold metallo-hydrolase [Enterobacter kobei]|uniref:MBL fold metallo-hydrolase n=1 Tax=Enterobacter asburiae TaxID=61645 RepID=UPI002912638C|nr:MBL fold metallo-hydrolase [Enterobacter asburiae]